ncbi:TOTE conflict system archaeo-eukaryotic primase domain-containing protein [Bacillus canaveralius]|uniref:TOTE conflict system archaeo-eukaryotic primase domain-containing protein n=1 Tax=Bacillus canaveralius TaxID=1403243 RepID=UPI001FE25937|nr:DEAD/DEAH box helicase family protein [Bacillus canaveralius]
MNGNIQLQQVLEECEKLRKENAYLKKLLSKMMQTSEPNEHTANNSTIVTKNSYAEDKIKLYRSLFQGRTDVYALRWESTGGKSGYTPACAHEWKDPICKKPHIKCKDCKHRTLLPLTDQEIANHLKGKLTVGLYPMQKDETCSFLAIDFDKQNWQEDVLAFVKVCTTLNVPSHIERSRSGNGAHVWIFFSENISSAVARKLGMKLLSKTREMRHEIGIDSYDRMFPNQDTLPNGGFGNLIALPMQYHAAKNGNSLFVDEAFTPYPDQWIYLSSVKQLSRKEIESILEIGHSHSLKEQISTGNLPSNVTVTLKNGILINKSGLTSSLMTKMVELASFKNPEFYKAQAKRMSTHGIPRIINCSSEDQDHLILPRGCLEELLMLLKESSIEVEIKNMQYKGEDINVSFHGTLSSQQQQAVTALLNHENGILAATTGFGKTVTAAALIAERKTNTLVIVHRTHLMEQWVQQLSAFFNIPSKEIGRFGGGKNNTTGNIDVATIQSLVAEGQLKSFVTQYGQIIVDECHHISAFSFEKVSNKLEPIMSMA